MERPRPLGRQLKLVPPAKLPPSLPSQKGKQGICKGNICPRTRPSKGALAH